MMSETDGDLLRQFVQYQSEAAFAKVVARHVNLVHSVALRQTGNAHSAEEITQAVFIILARKARQLRHDRALSSWLFQTTRLTANNFLRGEQRRQWREQEAFMQSTLNEATGEVWPQIAPLLDEAVGRLRTADRRAIVLRFYEGQTLPAMGQALGISPAAAEKRVSRALEKLRRFFAHRGVALTAAAIASAAVAHSVQAAPGPLAQAVTAGALAKGAAASTSTLTLSKGVLKIMAWTKVKTAAALGAGILLAAGGTTEAVRMVQQHRAEAWRTERFNPDLLTVLKATPPSVKILPTKYPQAVSWGYGGNQWDRRLVGINQSLAAMLGWANTTDLLPDRLVAPPDLPTNHFDYLANLPTNASLALAKELEKQLGLVERTEIRETNVYSLRMIQANSPGWKQHRGALDRNANWQMAKGIFEGNSMTASNLARFLEIYLATPVVDHTGRTGYYDFRLKLAMDEIPMDWKDHHLEDFQSPLRDQLGLELVPGREAIPMLVVERVR